MTRYRALERGYVNGEIVEPGMEFDYEGPAGKWMERVSSPSQTNTKSGPSPAQVTAPSTNSVIGETTVEDLLKVHASIAADLQPDQLTQSGYPKKTVLEAALGHEVPKDVFFNFIKVAAEQRRSAN